QLFTAQVLKEQYWKRTYGEVRTALEDTLYMLGKYGFGVEMGHKEVGGVKAKMGTTGHYDHVMEQLEIDWKYADAMQAADNENQVKYIVRDIFTKHGLDVTFMAKPFDGVAGSGEHTHIGLAAKLKNGKMVSLFAPADMKKEFMSPLGFGALMGLLKNYEVVNPFISATNDSLNRLKPGFEAPVCIVTSLGKSVDQPSRNRTVLVGLIRDSANPLSTRFELRAPNPKSDTYLVLSTSFMAIIDGMLAVVEAGKTPAELEKSLSKKYGEEDFYLERDREYRSEEDVFEFYTQDEREKLFGRAPATVWENLQAFDLYPEKMKIYDRTFPVDVVMPGRATLKKGAKGAVSLDLAGTPVKKGESVMSSIIIDSYRTQVLSQWKTELHDRLIPETMDFVRSCRKLHTDDDYSDYDVRNWITIDRLRHEIAKTSLNGKSLLAQAKDALDEGRFDDAAELQLKIKDRVADLRSRYEEYKKNLL
ncbi:MAG: glutamine synthetase, partial [Eubacterium sp.]|nr:glutamine synthetase [Eubacterium sp.]